MFDEDNEVIVYSTLMDMTHGLYRMRRNRLCRGLRRLSLRHDAAGKLGPFQQPLAMPQHRVSALVRRVVRVPRGVGRGEFSPQSPLVVRT